MAKEELFDAYGALHVCSEAWDGGCCFSKDSEELISIYKAGKSYSRKQIVFERMQSLFYLGSVGEILPAIIQRINHDKTQISNIR